MTQPDTPRGLRLSFRAFRDGELKHEDEISTDSVTIGRAEMNVVRLDDEKVSDLHAALKLTKERKLFLTDMHSDEGTFVDGERVETRVEISPLSSIMIGPFELRFSLEDLSRPKPVAGDIVLPAGLAEEDEVLLAEQAEEVVKVLFDAWDSHDKLGIDNTKVPKIIEIFEVWGDTILSAQQFPRAINQVSIGGKDKQHADFLLSGEQLPAEPKPFPLLKQINGTMHLCFAENFEGTLFQGGQALYLKDLAKSGATKDGSAYVVPLTDDSRFVVRVSHIVLVGAYSAPAKKVAVSGLDLDATFMSLLLIFGLIATSCTVYMRSLPPPKPMTFEQMPDRIAKMIAPKKEEKKKEEKKPEIKVQTKKPDITPVPKPVEDRGKKDSKVKLKKEDRVAIDQAEQDRKAVAAAMSGIIGNTEGIGRGVGRDVSEGLAGLLATTGSSSVAGITGSRGLGFGGGDGVSGVGVVGTKGGGGGDGGYGKKFGTGKRKKARGSIDAGGGDTMVLGALDKSIVDKVIRDHLNQIRYCYQRELPKNPRLAGKVVVKFTIDGSGNVSQSNIKNSSMSSVAVESCINKRVQALRFPEPRGGGKVIVVYPFFFKAAG